MTSREDAITEAAINMILRYGMARTTMNDVAREAGISRQSLYASFATKEDVLRATIRYLADKCVASIETGFAASEKLADRLHVVLRHTAIESFELLQASPDADDIVSGFNAACKEELAEASRRYRTLIETLLSPYADRIEASGLTVPQLSDFVQKSTLTIKHEAGDKKHLLELARTLKVLVLNLAGES